MLKVTSPKYKDLTEEDRNGVPNNGAGKEYAGYIEVTHNGKRLLLENDAMEPEDASFHRDLNWIYGIIKEAYEAGVLDAQEGGHTT